MDGIKADGSSRGSDDDDEEPKRRGPTRLFLFKSPPAWA